MIEDDAGDINDSRKNRSKKKHGSDALIGCVLEARDPETCVDAHDGIQWENAMDNEYHSLVKNDTWDLVP